MVLNRNSNGIAVEGHIGTWYVIEEQETELHGRLFLLEHEILGDEVPSLIVNEEGELILDDVWNGFEDYEAWLIREEITGEEGN